MSKAPTLYEAVSNLMGPLMAEYARVIDEWDGELPVVIKLGGYEHNTTLQSIKDLDRAHTAAFEQKCKASATRRVRKGDLFK